MEKCHLLLKCFIIYLPQTIFNSSTTFFNFIIVFCIATAGAIIIFDVVGALIGVRWIVIVVDVIIIVGVVTR